MLIKIRSEEHKFTIPVPLALGLRFNGILAKIIKQNAKDIDISAEQIKDTCKKIRKELHGSKKLLKGIPLVDVKSGDGDTVQIFL